MTDDARIARLTELACKVYGEPACVTVNSQAARVRHGEAVMLHVFGDRPLDALEAALCALAGEPPPWAAELADQWRCDAREARNVDRDFAQCESLLACAEELLADAKGKP